MHRLSAPRILRVSLVVAIVFASLVSLVSAPTAEAASIAIADGDVAALIDAINTANINGVATTIELATGGTYTLTEPFSSSGDPVGLPWITGEITIQGNGATIMRSTEAEIPAFGIIYINQGGNLTLDRVTIKNGFTPYYGAGIFNRAGTLRLTNSTVADNVSSIDGGGINNNSGSTLIVINSTVSGNSSATGGGGIINWSQATVINSTISNNSAGEYGGAGLYNGAGSTIPMTNTIIAENVTLNAFVDVAGTFSGTHNLIGNGTGILGLTDGVDGNQIGTSDAPINPLLGELDDNGGPTPTMALLPGSPAINAGTSNDETPTTDQRGTTRPQGTANDIGAYELVLASAPVISSTITGTQGNNGWYTSDVSVSWSVTDFGSLISSAGCEPTTITTDTTGQMLTCKATNLGGTTTVSETIMRDATVPTVSYIGNLGTYRLTDAIAITCAATDATSGIASNDCADITGNATTFGPGTHTFSATATDNAGNVGTATASFVVGVNYADLCTMTQQYFRHPILARAACASLKTAQRADQVDNVRVERFALNMYRLQIRLGMVFRAVPVSDGQQLLAWSNVLD